MKTINVWLTDKEHNRLMKLKDELSWHDFIIKLAERGLKYGKDKSKD